MSLSKLRIITIKTYEQLIHQVLVVTESLNDPKLPRSHRRFRSVGPELFTGQTLVAATVVNKFQPAPSPARESYFVSARFLRRWTEVTVWLHRNEN
jgi:hypothetical protein